MPKTPRTNQEYHEFTTGQLKIIEKMIDDKLMKFVTPLAETIVRVNHLEVRDHLKSNQ